MANKKTFDREKMYRKIMPTYYDNNFALAPEEESEASEVQDFTAAEFDSPTFEEVPFDADDGEDDTVELNFENISISDEIKTLGDIDNPNKNREVPGFEAAIPAVDGASDNTVVNFPSRKKEPVSKETADVKSAIKQAVNNTVANLSKAEEDAGLKTTSEPRAAYGTYGEPVIANTPANAPVNVSHMRTSEIERIREQHSKIAIYNLTEKVILEKLDVVMENMNCCRCDRCKMDVVALTLNNMEPYYVVRAQDSPDYSKLEKEIADKATKAVLKSAIKVRKNPRH